MKRSELRVEQARAVVRVWDGARLREHAEALATALEDADPPAFLSLDSGMYFECAYCQGASPDREQVPHSDDCEWLAIMTRVRAYRESNHG